MTPDPNVRRFDSAATTRPIARETWSERLTPVLLKGPIATAKHNAKSSLRATRRAERHARWRERFRLVSFVIRYGGAAFLGAWLWELIRDLFV